MSRRIPIYAAMRHAIEAEEVVARALATRHEPTHHMAMRYELDMGGV